MTGTIPVRVQHAVPVLHKPPRARKLRTGVTVAETEAQVAVVEAGHFREVLPGDWMSPEGPYAESWMDPDPIVSDPRGRPWTVLTTGKRLGNVPITRAQFIDWLSGRVDYDAENEAHWHLDGHFDRAPLGVSWRKRQDLVTQGIEFEMEDDARSAMRSFLADRVRIAGDTVLIRTLPLAQAICDQPGVARPVLVLGRDKGRFLGINSPYSTLGRLADDVAAYWAPLQSVVGRCPIVDAFRSAFPVDPPDPIDAIEIALALPGILWDWIDLRERRSANRAEVGISGETRERLLYWVLGAQFGIPPREGVPAMLREAASVLDALAEADPEPNDFIEKALATHIRARVLPRIETPSQIPAEDVGFLSALAPSETTDA